MSDTVVAMSAADYDRLATYYILARQCLEHSQRAEARAKVEYGVAEDKAREAVAAMNGWLETSTPGKPREDGVALVLAASRAEAGLKHAKELYDHAANGLRSSEESAQKAWDTLLAAYR